MSENAGQFLQSDIDLILQNDAEYFMDCTGEQRVNMKENRNQNDKYFSQKDRKFPRRIMKIEGFEN